MRIRASRILSLLLLSTGVAHAATAPRLPRAGQRIVGAIRAGFTETVIADSLDSPVSMVLAADGRVFVCEQPGRLRVVRAGRLLRRPFVTVPTRAVEEEGLLGVALDPAFARTHRVYVLYTAYEPTRHNVIAYYRASGDTAADGGTIVYEFDTHAVHQHVGGALRFGKDGLLYASSGECGDGSLSQSLASTAGKLLRMRPDGSIPADNPFPTSTRGRHAAIWARGFRNAFEFDIHPRSGQVFVNDVGGSRYEEVDAVRAGDNLGWPMLEGPGHLPKLVDPRHAYSHEQGCCITGGAFYTPARPSMSTAWRDGYFFADYCANEIRWLAPGEPVRVQVFGHTTVPGPVDLRVAADGALWYLARGNSLPTGGPGTGWGMVVRVAPEPAGAGGVPTGQVPHHNLTRHSSRAAPTLLRFRSLVPRPEGLDRMTPRVVVRALPALVVLALLCIAATAPPPLMPAPPPLFNYCAQLGQVGGGSATQIFDQGARVSQPLPAGIVVAACSLHVDGTGWTWSELRVKEWDPLTLAPDPAAIALRSGYFGPSQMNYYTVNSVPAVLFVPPIVTQSVSGVAEPPRQNLAIEVKSNPSFFPYGLEAVFDANGNPDMPPAALTATDGTQSPLPGAHPVIAHAICNGDADLAALRVAQSVRRADAPLAAGTVEIAQRFRVPEAVELRWLEFAIGPLPGAVQGAGTTMPSGFATVGVVDGAGLGEPSEVMPLPLIDAAFAQSFYFEPGPRWGANSDFDHTIVLEPGHDYWLTVRTGQGLQWYARTLTGGESPAFAAGVGPLYTRPQATTGPWTQVVGQALDFTIIGRPFPVVVGVGAPALGRDGIRMQVAPNPSRELAEVKWSGGVGPVRLEVLDARGRRVATGEGGAAGTWRVTRGGSALPSGVYFVHARDTSGGHAVERIVIVR